MLKEIKEKEFNRINGMIDSYTTDINDLTKQAEKVDEKYRKLAEQEKKDITEALEYYRNLRDDLVTRRDSLGVEAAVVSKKTTAKKLKEAEEKEVVQDTIFPENNEEPIAETVENPTVETTPEPEATVEPKPVTTQTVIEDVWPEEKKEEETKNDDNDSWPDVVEEW